MSRNSAFENMGNGFPSLEILQGQKFREDQLK